MREHQQNLDTLRRSADEWRRRGLTPPEVIAAMVSDRVNGGPFPGVTAGQDPAYADFFTGLDAAEALANAETATDAPVVADRDDVERVA